jgi:tetratricopeptide (TPR) repeat protein
VSAEHEVPAGALDRFVAGRASQSERLLITRHLLRGCPSCCAHLRAVGFPAEAQPPPGAYDAALAEAEDAAARAVPKAPPAALLQELDRLPPEHREIRVRNQARFASLQLVEALVERSHSVRYQDPEQMLRDARLAVAAAEALRADTPMARAALCDARARAWGQLANAHRVRNEFARAQSAFEKAFCWLREGSGDGALHALLSRQLASLHLETRQFKTALRLLTEAVAISRRLGDQRGEAIGLMQIGIVMIVSGNPDLALRPLRFSFRMLHGPQDRDLKRAALLNIIRCWIELGRPERAYTLCADVEPLMADCRDTTVMLRWEWYRGLIDRDLALLDAAETRLRRAREGFLQLNFSREVAVVSLDLAGAYLHASKVPQALQAVADAIPIFRALGVEPDLLAALIQLGTIAHQTERALAVVRKVATQVRDGIAPAEQRRARPALADES